MEAIANLLLMALYIGLNIVWIIALVNHDGSKCEPDEEDPDKCKWCPFPCEHQ